MTNELLSVADQEEAYVHMPVPLRLERAIPQRTTTMTELESTSEFSPVG